MPSHQEIGMPSLSPTMTQVCGTKLAGIDFNSPPDIQRPAFDILQSPSRTVAG